MKKLLALLLILCMLFTLVACNGGGGVSAETTKGAETTKANNLKQDNDDDDDEPKIKTQGYILSVSTSTHSGSSYDLPNGMSVFYLLSDGTFLVFDGGQGLVTASIDADHLYAQLRDVADENGIDKIVISAWVITHAHQDHYGFARVFFPKYNTDVQVKAFFFNGVSGHSATTEVKQLITTNFPFATIRTLRVGERIALADVLIDVLMTPAALKEDLPNAFDEDNGGDFNNSSLVLKLTIGTKTVLMTGDASTAAWNWLAAKYPVENGESKLKSDILQVPHHGSKSAGTNAGYDLVDADTIIYPAGERLYKNCVNSSTSQYQTSTVYLITKTAKNNGDNNISPSNLNTLLTKDYFYLAGEYLGTETDLTDTRQCFIIAD